MIDSFFEQSVLELDAGAKDFQRAVDNQLSIFEKEKDLHEKTVQELNREPKHGVVKSRENHGAEGTIRRSQRQAALKRKRLANEHGGD